MKVVVNSELKKRLICASANGSVVASNILEVLKQNKDVSEVIRGTSNYFNTKRVRRTDGECLKIKVLFTACTKDLENENFPDKENPRAPWFPENRADLEPSTFVKLFKDLPEYDSEEMEYFANAICVGSKIEIKLYDKMNDFVEGYLGTNYSPHAQYDGTSTLHNSCMRHAHLVGNVADFYANFAGANILVARDAEDNVLGRAIVWKNATGTFGDEIKQISVLDRLYYTHSFVMKMMIKYAQDNGIHLRKKVNDYCHQIQFIVMNVIEGVNLEIGESIDQTLNICVPALKWHKRGAPYLDTFSYINIAENGKIMLSNQEAARCIATCQQTDGTAEQAKGVCPNCGKVHSSSSDSSLCDACKEELFIHTIFGRVMKVGLKDHEGEKFPACFFKSGRPTPQFDLFLQARKLY